VAFALPMHRIPPGATLPAVAKKKRKRVVEPVTLKDRDLLWDYPRLSHLYGLVLIGVSLGLLLLSAVLEATSEDGWSWVWLGVVVGVAGITGLIFLPLLSVWLKRSGLASIRLPDAQQADTSRLLEAGDRDWRRWAVLSSVVIFIAAAFMLLFLVAVLGRGGTAEGVVIGVLAAWGVVTMADGQKIEMTQAEEGRRYWAAGQRPTGAGNRLVFTTRA
jgi:MFS family permease